MTKAPNTKGFRVSRPDQPGMTEEYGQTPTHTKILNLILHPHCSLSPLEQQTLTEKCNLHLATMVMLTVQAICCAVLCCAVLCCAVLRCRPNGQPARFSQLHQHLAQPAWASSVCHNLDLVDDL